MAIERDNKILNGAGLQQYTELLAGKFNAITTSIADLVNGATVIVTLKDAEDAIDGLDTRLDNVEDRLDDAEQAIVGQGDIIEGLTTTVDGLTTTVDGLTTTTIPAIEGDIDDLQDAIDGITTTISGISTTVDNLSDVIGDITTPLDETFKALQTAATLNAPAGEYISGITQDAQGIVGITTLALPTVPTASSTTPGLVTVVGVTNPTGTAYEVYSKEKLDELLDDVIGGDLSGIDGRLSDLEGNVQGTGAKRLQAAVSSPTAGSTPAVEFIDTISQNANGDITVTKQAVRTAAANVSGIVSLAAGATTAVVYDADQVDDAIAEAVASVFKAEVATADQDGYPDVQTPVENTIYLVPNGTGTEPNYYIEYMWMDGDPTGKWEVVGNTDLAIEPLSNNEVTAIFNGVFNS